MEYIYYWYHHGMPDKEQQKIYMAIMNHDFETFIDFYKKYTISGIQNGFFEQEEFDCWFPIIYFPNTITVFDGDEIVDYLSVFDRESFNKITYNECEHG